MPRKGIYDQDSTRLVKKENAERKIFEYLRKKKGQWVTQEQIRKSLGLSQSTVSRELNKLVGINKQYRKKEYIVICEEKNYQMTHPQNMPVPFTPKATPVQECKFNNTFEKEAYILSNSLIWNKSFATRITNTVILYEINSRYRSKVKTSLIKLFNKNIYDIVSCEKGLYIILRENENTASVRSRVLNLYAQAVEYSIESGT